MDTSMKDINYIFWIYPRYSTNRYIQYGYMRSFFSYKRICNFLCKPPHFTNKNVRDKPEKWETSFVAIVEKSFIGNKLRPPKSSMGTLFGPRNPKKRSFFTKKCSIRSSEVPQQHHLTRQHFGGHVA